MCVCVCVCVCVLCVSTAPGVCTLGWVKSRAHISLLVILCITVYVTNSSSSSSSLTAGSSYLCRTAQTSADL